MISLGLPHFKNHFAKLHYKNGRGCFRKMLVNWPQGSLLIFLNLSNLDKIISKMSNITWFEVFRQELFFISVKHTEWGQTLTQCLSRRDRMISLDGSLADGIRDCVSHLWILWRWLWDLMATAQGIDLRCWPGLVNMRFEFDYNQSSYTLICALIKCYRFFISILPYAANNVTEACISSTLPGYCNIRLCIYHIL